MVRLFLIIASYISISTAFAERVQLFGDVFPDKPFTLTVSCESQTVCDSLKLTPINFSIIEQHQFSMNGTTPKLMVSGKSDRIGVKKLIISSKEWSEEFSFVQTIRSRDSFVITDVQKSQVSTWEPNRVCFSMVAKELEFIADNEPVFRDARSRQISIQSVKKKLNQQQDFWLIPLSCYNVFAESKPSVTIKPPIYKKKSNRDKIFADYVKIPVIADSLKSGIPWGLPKVTIETLKREYKKFDQIPIKVTIIGSGYLESFNPVTIYPEETLEEIRRDEIVESKDYTTKKVINLIYYARESFSLEKSKFIFKYFDPSLNKILEDQVILPPLIILAESSLKQSIKETSLTKSESSGLAERLTIKTDFSNDTSLFWHYLNGSMLLVIFFEIICLRFKERSKAVTVQSIVRGIKTSQFTYLKLITRLNFYGVNLANFHPDVMKELDRFSAKEYGPNPMEVSYFQKRRDKKSLLKKLKKYSV